MEKQKVEQLISKLEKYVVIKIYKDAENKSFAKVYYKSANGDMPAFNPWEMKTTDKYDYSQIEPAQKMAVEIAKSILPYYTKSDATGDMYLENEDVFSEIPSEIAVVKNNYGHPILNEDSTMSYDSMIAGCKPGTENIMNLIAIMSSAVNYRVSKVNNWLTDTPLFVYDGNNIIFVNEKEKARVFGDQLFEAYSDEERKKMQDNLFLMAGGSNNENYEKTVNGGKLR